MIFRTFKATNSWGSGKHVDTRYIISYDNGETFTTPRVINELDNGIPMLSTYIGNNEYMIPFYNKYVDIKTFRVHGDSLLFKQIHSFNQDEWMTDLKEPVITINKGEINLIFRNYSHPGVYISQRSLESHGTFSVPKQTNMISENRISLPLLFFDAQFTRKYWFLAGDRPYNNKEKSKLYLYSNEDMGNPFTFEQSIDRPIPNSWQFYGYPTVTLMKNGKYLVVFTESYMDYENNENADFYQFTLTPTKSKIVSK